MATERLVIFDAEAVLRLLAHYDQGENLPMDVELLNVGVSPFVQRWIGFECRSNKWQGGKLLPGGGLSPLHMRYQGKRVMTFDGDGVDPTWKGANDDPARQ